MQLSGQAPRGQPRGVSRAQLPAGHRSRQWRAVTETTNLGTNANAEANVNLAVGAWTELDETLFFLADT